MKKLLLSRHDYLTLAASIAYQLSGTPINHRAILVLVTGGALPEDETGPALEALGILERAYGSSKRRLGPAAVIHPLRAAALMARAAGSIDLSGLLAGLFHDKNEDLTGERIGPAAAGELASGFERLLVRIPADRASELVATIEAMTRRDDEKYYRYLGRLLPLARSLPLLMRAKLADRLDNTMDLSMDIQDRSAGLNCYRIVFDALFVNAYAGQPADPAPPVEGKIPPSERLYQLFKNTVFMSLARSAGADAVDGVAERLFRALAAASILEGQQILLHLFAYHLRDAREQRAALDTAMEYCRQGAINRITDTRSGRRLDGLFSGRFDPDDREALRRRLDDLNADRELMAEAAVVFIAIFSGFINDPAYRIEGIGIDGLRPEES